MHMGMTKDADGGDCPRVGFFSPGFANLLFIDLSNNLNNSWLDVS